MLGLMNVGAYNFFTQFFDLTKDDFGENCDLDAVDKGAYSGVNAIVQQIKDRASCQANIMKIFAIMDRDNNGLITRCEDASFQFAMGSKQKYALKFSS